MGSGRSNEPGCLSGPGDHSWYDHGVLRVNSGTEWNLCQPIDSTTDWSKRYGIGLYEHAFVLVVLYFFGYHAWIPVCRIRSSICRMDHLSTFKCAPAGHRRIWSGDDFMAYINGNIYCFFPSGFPKLYCYGD